MGYYSYRLGIQSMAEMNISDRYPNLIKTLKHSLDPAGILAPGRYEPTLAAHNSHHHSMVDKVGIQ
jgi:4-cresol dehydrogenase (hydroxylating)